MAPYEADAQLAYLEMQGITDFTISEDSDLLIYGCRKVCYFVHFGNGDCSLHRSFFYQNKHARYFCLLFGQSHKQKEESKAVASREKLSLLIFVMSEFALEAVTVRGS